MRLKREKVDNYVERQLAIGAIVSQRFLSQFSRIYKAELVSSPHIRTIVKWCLTYYKKYEKAPKEHIKEIYASQVRKGLEAESVDMISDLLESISSEYSRERFNCDCSYTCPY